MITDLKRTILYFCPDCSTLSMRMISVFELKKNETIKMKCSNRKCNIHLVTVTAAKDKYRITVDCSICGETHSFNISQKTLWTKDFFILNCPHLGFGILFVGTDKKRLKDEYDAQSEIIAGIMAEEELDEGLDMLFEIIGRIGELLNNHAIECECGNKDISVRVDTDSIHLICKKCKREYICQISEETLDNINMVDSILLH